MVSNLADEDIRWTRRGLWSKLQSDFLLKKEEVKNKNKVNPIAAHFNLLGLVQAVDSLFSRHGYSTEFT